MGENLKPEYFKISRRIGQTVDEVVARHYENISKTFPEKSEIVNVMVSRKVGKQKLRATAAGLAVYALIGSFIENPVLNDLFAAIELVNWDNYARNWLADGKVDSNSALNRRKVILCVGGFFHDALQIVSSYDPRYTQIFTEIDDRVLRGFQAESHLSINNENILNNKELFEKYYSIRNIEAGGQFYENYVRLAEIFTRKRRLFKNIFYGLSSSRTNVEKLKVIYRRFGEGVQILNDLSDFIIPDTQKVSTEKNSADQFSDLRTGTVSRPIWLMYDYSNGEDKEFLRSLQGKIPGSEEQRRILELFYGSGAYDTVKKQLKDTRTELYKAVHELDIAPRYRGLLECMMSILSSSRYYHRLDDQRIY